jgi:hypothetical protein
MAGAHQVTQTLAAAVFKPLLIHLIGDTIIHLDGAGPNIKAELWELGKQLLWGNTQTAGKFCNVHRFGV